MKKPKLIISADPGKLRPPEGHTDEEYDKWRDREPEREEELDNILHDREV